MLKEQNRVWNVKRGDFLRCRSGWWSDSREQRSILFPGGWFRVPTKDFHQTHGDCVYASKGWTTRDVKYLEARPGRSAPSGGALLSAEAFQCTLGKPSAALDEPQANLKHCLLGNPKHKAYGNPRQTQGNPKQALGSRPGRGIPPMTTFAFQP